MKDCQMKRIWILFFLPIYLLSTEKVVDLNELGKIIYYFDGDLCKKIVRISDSGDIKYEHQYQYDENNHIVSENLIGNLGKVFYSGNIKEGYLEASSPFGKEYWKAEDKAPLKKSTNKRLYNKKGLLVKKGTSQFFYHGSKLERIEKVDRTVLYIYDKLGRKVSKQVVFDNALDTEFYLFLGSREIGSFSSDGKLKWLRIPGLSTHPTMVRAIAIETNNAIYAPIYDFQWNIVKLIDIETGEVIDTRPNLYGKNLAHLDGCPWTFCSKRYDPDAELVDFGYRHYDPELCEWLTPDPLNKDPQTYRYCFNNPSQYIDPDGQFAFVIPVLTWTGAAITSPLWGTGALATAGGVLIGYVGYKTYDKCQSWYKSYQKKKEPPFKFEDLGYDPSKCPGEGFKWKGKGSPTSGKGNWVKGKRPDHETLNPDLEHGDPVGPHWDYTGPEFPNGVRIKPNGTYEIKP